MSCVNKLVNLVKCNCELHCLTVSSLSCRAQGNRSTPRVRCGRRRRQSIPQTLLSPPSAASPSDSNRTRNLQMRHSNMQLKPRHRWSWQSRKVMFHLYLNFILNSFIKYTVLLIEQKLVTVFKFPCLNSVY